ncbi:MAG: hypothetical protein AB4063_19010 [Crocosphaera sp.]
MPRFYTIYNPIDENDTFWDMILRFREQMDTEGVEFTNEDFANLRDRIL